MSIKNTVKRLISKIVRCYRNYNVSIVITHYQICENGKRFIFRIEYIGSTKKNDIFRLAEDVKTRLGLAVFIPFMDDGTVCLAVAKDNVMENNLRRILQSRLFRESPMKIPMAIGFDVRGDMFLDDLYEIKHLLIGGATNTGKTVALRCLIFSILSRQSPDEVNLVLFDIWARGLDVFDGVPHLSCPVVKDEDTGMSAMLALRNEMKRREKLDDANLALLPSIVIVVDEFVSFVTSERGRECDRLLPSIITEILRRGRHVNMHLVLATQDAKIKSGVNDLGNIRARMAFACGEVKDSVSILGEGGAEDLPGKGAMLYKSLGGKSPLRLQGANITDEELERVIAGETFQALLTDDREYKHKFKLEPYDLDSNLTTETRVSVSQARPIAQKKVQADLILWALAQKKVAMSGIPKCFHLGRREDQDTCMSLLEQWGIISEKNSNQPRKVLPQCKEDLSDDVKELLATAGITDDNAYAAFAARTADSTATPETTDATPE